MKQISLSPERFKNARALLRSYYGLKLRSPRPDSDGSITIGTSADTDSIERAYDELIGSNENSLVLKDALILLSWYVINTGPALDANSSKEAFGRYLRQDLLRIHVFFNSTVKSPGAISLRSRDGSVKLDNCCNWIWEDLLKDYLREKLPDIKSAEQAGKELLNCKNRRGRRPNDKRVPVLLWGTYRMLSDKNEFSSSMPNALCEFIITLIQAQGLFPQDTEIDAQWIRAQLRYIKTKDQKPSFSNMDDQSSIMKGAQ